MRTCTGPRTDARLQGPSTSGTLTWAIALGSLPQLRRVTLLRFAARPSSPPTPSPHRQRCRWSDRSHAPCEQTSAGLRDQARIEWPDFCVWAGWPVTALSRDPARTRNPAATSNRNGATACAVTPCVWWLRGLDLNQRPLGYEPNELPGCSTPRCRDERYCAPGPLSSRRAAAEDRRGLPWAPSERSGHVSVQSGSRTGRQSHTPARAISASRV